MNCSLCPLHKTAITVCVSGHGEGSTLIVGRNPDPHDDSAGLPFVGKGGRLLREMLGAAGWKPEDYRLSYAVRCKAPQNRPPENAEIEACRVHLKDEILSHKPSKIIALGDAALRTLTRKSGVKTHRGQSLPLHSDFEYECEVWPTYDPGYVMKIQPVRNTVVADFRKIRDSGLEREHVEWRWAEPSDAIHIGCTVAWDIETDYDFEKKTGGNNITQIGLATDCGDVVVTRDNPAEFFSGCATDNTFVTHNGWAFDVPRMRAAGCNVAWGDDTMALMYLDDETQPLSLEAGYVKYCGGRGWKDERVAPQGSDEFALYNARDAVATLKLHSVLIERLGERKKIADVILLPTWQALMACSERGVYISADAVVKAREVYGAQLEQRRAEVIALATTDLQNPNSDKQVGVELMARGFVLPPTPSGGFSVAKDVLNELVGDPDDPEPFVFAQQRYNEAQTLMSSFIVPYERIVLDETSDRRSHADYTILRARTGRSTARARKPVDNLWGWYGRNDQNLPRDPLIRAFHSAPPGKELLSMDYKAIEFGLAAFIARERGILDRYIADPNWDPHRFFTARLYSKTEDEVTKEERNNVGKSANFGLLYLASPHGLQEYMLKNGIRMTYAECERIWWVWHETFPGFGHVIDGTIFGGNAARVWKFIEKNGYIDNAIGRRRHFGDVSIMNLAQKGEALREAVNMQVQSLAFEIAGLGLAQCHQAGLPVVAFLHDDIKFEFDEGESASKLEEIAYLMVDKPLAIIEREFGVKIDVPLLVEHKIVKGIKS